MNCFKIAIVQMNSEFLNIEYNLKKSKEFIREAALNGAKLICFPEAFLINDAGRIVGEYDKCHLIEGEKNIVIPGDDIPVWETGLGTIGCIICYDLCFPEMVRKLVLKGAQIILAPSAWTNERYYSNW